MEIILLERVEKIGQMGEVVTVKTGYARNYLLPQKKAVRATEENRKRFQEQRVQLEASNLERKAEAEQIAKPLEGLTVVLIRQAGESGQLYGSVNARDIAEAVTEAGATIRRQQVWLSTPIKALGMHPVSVNLHPEVTIEVSVNVARSIEEAETQARTGRAVGRSDEEEETLDTDLGAGIGADLDSEEQASAGFDEDVVDDGEVVAGDGDEDVATEEVAGSADEEPSAKKEATPPSE